MSLRAWREAATSLGYDLTDELCDRMVGRTAQANIEALARHFGAGFPGPALAEAAGLCYRRLLAAEGVPHKPGLLEFLRFLDARAVPRAVATSTATALAREKLDRAGVLPFLDVVVGGDRVSRGKPAPDIFLAAAGLLGFEPASCLVLEDSEPGIRAAAAAGMRGVLIPDGRPPGDDARRIAHVVVESLAGAQAVIEQLI